MNSKVCPLCGSEIVVDYCPYYENDIIKASIMCANDSCIPYEVEVDGEKVKTKAVISFNIYKETLAGMSDKEKKRLETFFKYNYVRVLTNYLDNGEGIDDVE